MRKVLVVGGAGYIGSHMVKMLLQSDIEVVVLDNLSTGYRDAILGGEFVEGDIADSACLDQVFTEHKFDGVMHFASFIEVGESVKKPGKYYRNNFCNTLNLLDALIRHDVDVFIFSSTAAIFGDPVQVPIDETHPSNPISPYGKSKWMVEQALRDYGVAHGLRAICLRYFNAAGSDPEGELGERHEPESHLIPLVLRAASGRRENISIFGSDYDTRDGTCVRDYVHVLDLCQAHLLALGQLWKGSGSSVYNLGNGQGFTVQEVISTSEEVTGRRIPVVQAGCREGDTGTLVAESNKALRLLGWDPQFADLTTIIEHAWTYEKKVAGLE
jgi:UDP-glucose 4-epimerase